MKKRVISVEKLKTLFQGEKELRAFPVQTAQDVWQEDGTYSSIRGFYIGTLPVYDQGYGIRHTYNGLYFRGKDLNDFPIKMVEGSHMYLDEHMFLTFEGKHYLSTVHAKSRLIRFGFTPEQVEESIEELVFPYADTELKLSHEEIGVVLEQLEGLKETNPTLYAKFERAYRFKPSFMLLKYQLQEQEKGVTV